MNRRKSLSKIAVGFFASLGLAVFNTCKLIADHFSKYSWPSYPKEYSLRKHLLGKPHYLSREEVDAMTFTECREIHDRQHTNLGGKPPSQSRLWMNRSYKKPKTPEEPPVPPPVPAPPSTPSGIPITDVEIRPPY